MKHHKNTRNHRRHQLLIPKPTPPGSGATYAHRFFGNDFSIHFPNHYGIAANYPQPTSVPAGLPPASRFDSSPLGLGGCEFVDQNGHRTPVVHGPGCRRCSCIYLDDVFNQRNTAVTG